MLPRSDNERICQVGAYCHTWVANLQSVAASNLLLPVGIRTAASSADQGWYLKTLPPFITNAIWRSAVASAR